MLELLRWSNSTSDVIARAISEPVRIYDRGSCEGVAFLRVLVLSCLKSAHSGKLLDELAAEIREGRHQLSEARHDIDARITRLQAFARGRLARNDFKSRVRRALATFEGYCGLANTSCLVFGSLNMDLKALSLSVMPTINGPPGIGIFSQMPGGKGANEAVAIARLGVKTYLQGKVGQDALGASLLATMQKAGHGLLDTTGVTQGEEGVMTGVAVQVTSQTDQKRISLVCAGANNCLDGCDVQLARNLLLSLDKEDEPGANVGVLLLQLEVATAPMIEVARFAHNLGCVVALKASPLPPSNVERAQQLLSSDCVDALFVNEFEAPTLLHSKEKLVTSDQANATAKAILSQFPSLRLVVITCSFAHVLHQRTLHYNPCLTSRASWFDGEMHVIAPRRSALVVDITAAADAFAGGFIAAKSRGLNSAQALLWADAAGTICTQRAGAQDAMADLSEISSFFKNQMQGIKQEFLMQRLPSNVMLWPMDLLTSSSGQFLLQNRLHLCVLRRDIWGLIDDHTSSVGLDSAGSSSASSSSSPEPPSVEVHLRDLLLQSDSFGCTPLERAQDLYKCTRDPAMFWLLRLWLTSWLCLASYSDVAAVPAPGDTLQDASGLPASLLSEDVMRDVLNVVEAEDNASAPTPVAGSFSGPFTRAGQESIADDRGAMMGAHKLPHIAAQAIFRVLLALTTAEKPVQLVGRELIDTFVPPVFERLKLDARDVELDPASASATSFVIALLKTRDERGKNILSAAAGAGSIKLVDCLLGLHLGAEFTRTRDQRGRTALHLSARGGHVEVCRLLVRHGGLSLEDADAEGETPLAVATSNAQRTRANVSREALQALQALNRETRSSFGAFLSHCKAEAEGAARTLKEFLGKELEQPIFLDSDDLKDLSTLTEHVRKSQVLVLLQTRRVLERPYCLLELLTAAEKGLPIIGVNIATTRREDGYDFEDAVQFLHNLDTQLDARTPGASRILEEHGYVDLREAGAKLAAAIPKVISLQLNFAASARVLRAMKEDLRDEVKRQQMEVRQKGFQMLDAFENTMLGRNLMPFQGTTWTRLKKALSEVTSS